MARFVAIKFVDGTYEEFGVFETYAEPVFRHWDGQAMLVFNGPDFSGSIPREQIKWVTCFSRQLEGEPDNPSAHTIEKPAPHVVSVPGIESEEHVGQPG